MRLAVALQPLRQAQSEDEGETAKLDSRRDPLGYGAVEIVEAGLIAAKDDFVLSA